MLQIWEVLLQLPEGLSQFVYYDKARGSAIWQLAALNKEAAEEILYVSGRLPQNLYLKQKEYVVQLSKPQPVKQTSYKDMAEQFFTMPQPPRQAEFNFITSASFKAFGSYKIYPDNVYIFRSLLKLKKIILKNIWRRR